MLIQIPIYGFLSKKEIEEPLLKLTSNFRPWIGLRIRMGDFIKLNLALPVEKYKEALEKVYNNQNVFIASNDNIAKKDFSKFNLINMSNPLKNIPDYIFDFWMLKNAQTVIGRGSTFSWWAAYLSNKDSYYSVPLVHLWKRYKQIEITKQNLTII